MQLPNYIIDVNGVPLPQQHFCTKYSLPYSTVTFWRLKGVTPAEMVERSKQRKANKPTTTEQKPRDNFLDDSPLDHFASKTNNKPLTDAIEKYHLDEFESAMLNAVRETMIDIVMHSPHEEVLKAGAKLLANRLKEII